MRDFKDIVTFTVEKQSIIVNVDGEVFNYSNKPTDDEVIAFNRFYTDCISGNLMYKDRVYSCLKEKGNYSYVFMDKKILDKYIKNLEGKIKHLQNSCALRYQECITTTLHHTAIGKYILDVMQVHVLQELKDALVDMLEGKAANVTLYLAPRIFDILLGNTSVASISKRTKYQYGRVSNTPPSEIDKKYIENTLCLRLSVEKTEQTPLIVNSTTLYTTLNMDVDAFYRKYCELFPSGYSLQRVLSDIYSSGEQGYLEKAMQSFNVIKAKLMLYGDTEQVAVDNILNIIEIKHKVSMGSFTCSITKQILPDFLRVELQEGVPINIFYIAMHSRATGAPVKPGGPNLYWISLSGPSHAKTYSIVENTPSEDCYRYSVRRNHRFNPLTILSPRATAADYTKISSTQSTYIPVPYMGVELEVEQNAAWEPEGVKIKMPKINVTEDVYDILGRDFVVLKHDGSLHGHNPFEIVTIPATLAYHKERWKPFLADDIKKHLKSYTTDSCGMHIHISRDSFTGLHLAKFIRFINSMDNRHFVESVAQRAHNAYSMYSNMDLKYCANNLVGGERKMAVNVTNKDTIEVRIFKGNLATIGFLKNLEFVHSLHTYTKYCSMSDLSYKKYLSWLLNPEENVGDYDNLRLWLIKKGFNIDNVVVKRTTPPELLHKVTRQRDETRKKKVKIINRYEKKRLAKDDEVNTQELAKILVNY